MGRRRLICTILVLIGTPIPERVVKKVGHKHRLRAEFAAETHTKLQWARRGTVFAVTDYHLTQPEEEISSS